MRGCWQAWIDVFETRRVLQRSVQALLAPGTRRALVGWSHAAGEARLDLALLVVAVSTLRSVGIRRALNTLATHGAARRRLLRVGSSLRYPQRRAALTAWVSYVADLQARYEALRRSVQALRQGGLRRSFSSWASAASEAGEARRRLRMAASESGGGRLRGCWLSWCLALDRTYANLNCLSVALQRLLFIRCFAAFHVLVDGRSSRLRRSALCKGMIRSRHLRKMFAAFCLWVCFPSP